MNTQAEFGLPFRAFSDSWNHTHREQETNKANRMAKRKSGHAIEGTRYDEWDSLLKLQIAIVDTLARAETPLSKIEITNKLGRHPVHTPIGGLTRLLEKQGIVARERDGVRLLYSLTREGHKAAKNHSAIGKAPTSSDHAVATKTTRKPEAKSKGQDAQNKKRKVADPYDFDAWFDALNADQEKPIILVKGKDFTCMVNSMAVQLRTAAGHFGIKITVNMPDEKHLVLRKRLVFGSE